MIKKSLILLVIMGLAACETTPPSVQSGPDAEITYDGLVRVNNAKLSHTWVKPGIDISQYSKVMLVGAGLKYKAVRNVSRMAPSGASEFPLTDTQKEKIRENVSDVFTDELSQLQHFALADASGTDVLQLTGMLIDIVSNVPPERIGRVDYYLNDLGAATLVLELSDSLSGEVFVRAIDRRFIENRSRMKSNPVTNRGELRQEVRKWATILRNGIDSLHEMKSIPAP